MNKFPKFPNKMNESFIDWYEDVLCILALSEWNAVYDSTTNNIYETTMSNNSKISEHLYSALRLALHGEAGSIMKSNKYKFKNLGIEFLQSMKPIFHPKWPPLLHNSKMVAFLEYFRKPGTSVDTYANEFKCRLCNLQYNGISIPPKSVKNSFMQGLGSEFIPI